jgi:GT2 family glycosyltransferase
MLEYQSQALDKYIYGTLMELAVIILNWNAAVDTIRCAQHVATWKHLHPTIWIVDNGSTDDSPDVISRQCPDAHLVRNTTNLGFAGGNNRGIVEALAVGDTPILLLNNDAFIEEKDATRLLNTLQANEQIGFIGPLLFEADEKDRLLAAGGRDPVRHHLSHILRLTPGDPVRIVEYVPGTVLLGRSDLFHTVGLLDEDYFFTMEVADLCMQAKQHGYVSAVDTRARALHILSRSDNLRETLHTYYIIRNRFLFIRKFYPKQRILFYSFWTLYSLALYLKVRLSGKPATARAIWLGLFDGLHGRFGRRNELFLR